LTRSKSSFSYQTGALIKATVPKGKYQGERVGRVAVRASGGFNVNTVSGTVTVSHKHCRLLLHGDGYEYSYRYF
jgi:hypothetical protein